MSEDNITTNDTTQPADTPYHADRKPTKASPPASARPVPREPLSPQEAQRAEEEAIQRSLEAGGGASETRRRGRIEAETHRVSEEVTRQARERERLAASGQYPPADTTSAAIPTPTAAGVIGHRLPAPWPLRRVLVPLDGSPLAEQALGLTLGLATVGQPTRGQEPSGMRELALVYVADNQITRFDGDRYLAEVSDRLRQAGLPPTITITSVTVVGAVPGDVIVEIAARGVRPETASVTAPAPEPSQPFDLVVLATHGRRGLGRWLYGSVATDVLEHSTVPVLIVHPHATAEY